MRRAANGKVEVVEPLQCRYRYRCRRRHLFWFITSTLANFHSISFYFGENNCFISSLMSVINAVQK